MENNNQSSVKRNNEATAYPHEFQYRNQIADDEIDLADLFKALWAGKFLIIIVTCFFTVAGVFYAKSLPNIYKASVLLTSASSQGGAGGLAGLAGSFGGLASMAGINLGGGQTDNSALALEIIKSRGFIETFIEKHELLVPIMAANGWNQETDTLLINDNLYDVNTGNWLGEVTANRAAMPSSWEAFDEFSKLISIEQDKTTSIISIDIKFYSPILAKQWLKWLVADINEYMREQDEMEAKNSIAYLQEKLEETKLKSMEGVFYQLIEEQSKTLMLTKVKPEYVLKTIDPAQTPDIKDSPKRALIVVLTTLLGAIIASLLSLVQYFLSTTKSKSKLDSLVEE